jgi:hypothetical protein
MAGCTSGLDSEPGSILGGRRGAIRDEGEVGQRGDKTVTKRYIHLGLDGGRDSKPCETMGPGVLKGRKVEVGSGTRQVGQHRILSQVALQSGSGRQAASSKPATKAGSSSRSVLLAEDDLLTEGEGLEGA